MKCAIALLFAALCSSAAACDQVDAARVQIALAEAGASWSERDGRVALEWGWAWDGAGSEQKLRLLRAFAEGDACLAGRARPISFFRDGRLVGLAAPGAGVRLAGAPAASAAARKEPARCP